MRKDDLISRRVAIDAVNSRKTAEQCKEGEIRNWTVDACVDMIKQLPLAEPKRIRGKWIKHEHGYWTFVNADGERDGWIPDYECDQCGSRGWKEVAPMNFCPNCGAKMEVQDG